MDEELPPNAKQDIKALMESPGWAILLRALDGQIKSRTDFVIYNPLNDSDAVYKQEFMKGEINAFGVLRTLPDRIIAAIELDQEINYAAGSRDAESEGSLGDE